MNAKDPCWEGYSKGTVLVPRAGEVSAYFLMLLSQENLNKIRCFNNLISKIIFVKT